MAAYNGINAIKKAMDVNTTYLCWSNHFDLISSIDNKLMKYTLIWSWKHLKEHQDKQGEPLDRWDTTNVEYDY